jgi:hypothetical protein
MGSLKILNYGSERTDHLKKVELEGTIEHSNKNGSQGTFKLVTRQGKEHRLFVDYELKKYLKKYLYWDVKVRGNLNLNDKSVFVKNVSPVESYDQFIFDRDQYEDDPDLLCYLNEIGKGKFLQLVA